MKTSNSTLRAKLVKRAEDYRWLSARAHVLRIEDDVISDEGRFSDKEIKSYREFISKDAKEMNESIRRATSTGRPLGRDGFIRKLERILELES